MQLFSTAVQPNDIAVRDPDSALSWQELDDTLVRFVAGLDGFDLGAARRIAVFAENAVETGVANLGGLVAGASVVPVNFHLTAEEAAYILKDSNSRVLFLGPETAERGLAAARLAGVEQVVIWQTPTELSQTEGESPQPHAWQDWLSQQVTDALDLSRKPLPNLLYTSGTTGRPKGTELPPTMFAGGDTIAEHLQALSQSPLAPLGPHLIVGPMYHTGPLSGARLLVAGTPSVILKRFDAGRTLAAIEEFGIATSVMVPTHFVRLLAVDAATRAAFNPSSLARIAHTGAKCPVEVKRAMIEWWGPVLTEAYGASEVGTTCAITSEEWLENPGSVGQAVEPFSVLVLDDDDNEVPPNTEGRLYFVDATGRGVVYHNDKEKSAAAHIRPGVFTLGEIGYVNEAGFVFITDRFSDMVVSGGVNLYPAEAEQVLIEHDDVLDVACIGVPHPEMGEELRALVIQKTGATLGADELISWCRERLSSYKCPRSLSFVEDLGRNTMGKINKRKLRAPFWENA